MIVNTDQELVKKVRKLHTEALKISGVIDTRGDLHDEVRKLGQAVDEIKRKLGMRDSRPCYPAPWVIPYIQPYPQPWDETYTTVTWGMTDSNTTKGSVQ